MIRMLILADDFTGALDTGVQFAARGAVTRVVTGEQFDYSKADPGIQVLVMDSETRHKSAEEAGRIVLQAVREARRNGVEIIYKKTDSALRGNIGAELAAVLEGTGERVLPFIPALPRMNRITRQGVQYINGVPVAESVFGRDPFEPVRHSHVGQIIAEQSDAAVTLYPEAAAPQTAGIAVYDAASEEDLKQIAGALNTGIYAGCAGFAPVLADKLGIHGTAPGLPRLDAPLFVLCGSVNQVTVKQLETAQEAGYPRFTLKPEEKLEPAWLESRECTAFAQRCLEALKKNDLVMVDANDAPGRTDTMDYCTAKGWSIEQLRVSIAHTLGIVAKQMLDGGFAGTILCTGGDTLLAVMEQVQVSELTPIGEADTGAVLTTFRYAEKDYYIISKSGGFGAPELFTQLACQFRQSAQN